MPAQLAEDDNGTERATGENESRDFKPRPLYPLFKVRASHEALENLSVCAFSLVSLSSHSLSLPAFVSLTLSLALFVVSVSVLQSLVCCNGPREIRQANFELTILKAELAKRS